jgi:hypothetical protein
MITFKTQNLRLPWVINRSRERGVSDLSAAKRPFYLAVT